MVAFSTVFSAVAINFSTDPNYSSPGAYGMPSTYNDGTNEKNLLSCLEVIRAYIAVITDHSEAKTFHNCVSHMISALPLGGGTTAAFPASAAATRAQALALEYYTKQVRTGTL